MRGASEREKLISLKLLTEWESNHFLGGYSCGSLGQRKDTRSFLNIRRYHYVTVGRVQSVLKKGCREGIKDGIRMPSEESGRKKKRLGDGIGWYLQRVEVSGKNLIKILQGMRVFHGEKGRGADKKKN